MTPKRARYGEEKVQEFLDTTDALELEDDEEGGFAPADVTLPGKGHSQKQPTR